MILLKKFFRDEDGFFLPMMMTICLVFLLTAMTFILGIEFGVMKQAQAKYDWFGNAMTFASSAAGQMNPEDTIDGEMAEQFFEAAMERMNAGDYTLKSFTEVEPGDYISKVEGTAKLPGYYAVIEMPIAVVNVPLVGRQYVNVPMGYYALGYSPELQ